MRNNWANTAIEPVFILVPYTNIGVNYKALFPILIVLFTWYLPMIFLAIIAIVFFGILEKIGFSPSILYRWVRSRIAGKTALGTPRYLQNR